MNYGIIINAIPVILKAMQEDEEFKEEIKEMVDEILPLIRGEIE